ncbi:hypothetical protein QBC39DRAFT_267496 [Podospora conica]|nr:hypothetical protein QBC39DRAFT_267496 [Schizothecium conicum]
MGLLDDAASAISVRSSHSKKSRSHKSHRHRSRSPGARSHHSSTTGVGGGGGLGGIAASIFGGGGDDKHTSSSDSDRRRKKKHHSSSARSIFGTDDYKKNSASRSSFFGIPTGGSNSGRSPSYYKRSPRPNFVTRVVKRLKRLLRDLVYYAKRHPLKVFMLVVMPLVTGGFLTALLAKFGLKLPAFLTHMIGMAGKAASGDGIGLVGDAVRMASGGAGAGGLAGGLAGNVARATMSVERGRDAGGSWERRRVERDIVGSGGGSGGWGALAGVAKFFS